jgi:Uma2 family endonuclease
MVKITTSPLVKTYTLEEFWELPDPPDHSKLELIAGVLYMTPPPGNTHDSTVMRLNRLITEYLIKTKDPGDLYVPRAAIWTTERTYLEPDLFYLSAETRESFAAERRTTADLVIEVFSPGSAIYDRHTKADTYAALGVRELWLVDEVEKTIEVRRLVGQEFHPGEIHSDSDEVTSSVLNGAVLDVRSVFIK